MKQRFLLRQIPSKYFILARNFCFEQNATFSSSFKIQNYRKIMTAIFSSWMPASKASHDNSESEFLVESSKAKRNE